MSTERGGQVWRWGHRLAGSMALYALFAFFPGDQRGSAAPQPKETKSKSGVAMVFIPGGSFTMGDPQGGTDEKPHKVWVRALYVDKYEVTQEEFEKVMGANPARWKGKTNPVEQVGWAMAVRYCNARSRREGLTPCYNLKTWECNFNANGYRLPTEAEWEYVARAGTQTSYFFGNDASALRNYAWVKENAGGRTRPVGQKLPNPWGLHDLYGNVWEWCNDFYLVDYYQKSLQKNPPGPKTGRQKAVRGGCWNSRADECRSSFRYNENPAYNDVCFGYDVYGFRCVRNAPGSHRAKAERAP